MTGKLSQKKTEMRLREVKKAAVAFQEALKKYPYKDISEFTRTRDQLGEFLEYGVWWYYNEDTGEEGKPV
jgi:hypothetical protein